MSKFDDNQSVDSGSLFTARFSETSRTGRSQSSAASASSSSNEDDRKLSKQNKPEVATKEEKAVFRAKVVLCTVLLATAFLSFFAVYKLGTSQEVDSLHTLVRESKGHIIRNQLF